MQRAPLNTDDQFLERATQLKGLQHRNLVALIHTGKDSAGAFAVASWQPSVTLTGLLAATAAEGLMPIEITARIGGAIARALSALAAPKIGAGAGWSTDDIYIGFDGRVRLSALRAAASHQGSSDIPDDLYLLGALLYRLITGEPPEHEAGEAPFAGDHRRELPPRLEVLVHDLLALDPDERLSDAQEVAVELEEIALETQAEPGASALQELLDEHLDAQKQRLEARIKKTAAGDSASSLSQRPRSLVANRIALVLVTLVLSALVTWGCWEAIRYVGARAGL